MKKVAVVLVTFIVLCCICGRVFAYSDGNIVVLLDPGHGGINDSGAVSNGLKETDIVWKIANQVKKILDEVSGIVGVLSRRENENPQLSERGQKAKDIAADLVMSFHINANDNTSANGAEVYVTRDTSQDRFNKYSTLLGNEILNNLSKLGISKRGEVKTRTTERGIRYPDGSLADYYGIIQYPMMKGIPSILIEHCFITNVFDQQFINNDSSISKLANADVSALLKYIDLFKYDRNRNSAKAKLKDISYNNNNGCVEGHLLYNEEIHDEEVIATPDVYMVSSDGMETIKGKVSKVSRYEYSFNINILDVNPYKKYYVEAKSRNLIDIPKNNIVTLSFQDTKMGKIYGMNILSSQNQIKFDVPTYDGYVNAFIYENSMDMNYNQLSAYVVVQEWINEINQIQPKNTPLIKLISNDNSQVICDVEYVAPYVYKFICDLNKLDMDKAYSIKVESSTEQNISKNRSKIISLDSQNIGKYDGYCVTVSSGAIVKSAEKNGTDSYDGYMLAYPYDAKMQVVGNNITGKIVVQEWIDGINQEQPKTNPKIVLRDLQGNNIVEVETNKEIPYVYCYKIDTSKLDEDTEYTMNVIGTNLHNVSTHQDIHIVYKDETVGKINNYVVKVYNGNLILENENSGKYDGYMYGYSFDGKPVIENNKIKGKVIVQEWIDGITQVEPATIPKFRCMDERGNTIAESNIKKIQPYLYSYELSIDKLKLDQKYSMCVIGTNPKNSSTHQQINIVYKDCVIEKNEISSLKIEKGYLINESNQYDGYMLSYPFDNKIEVIDMKVKGKLVVQEWLDGIEQIEPERSPKITLVDSQDKVMFETIMTKQQPYVYNFEIDISKMKQNELYKIYVVGNNPKNISDHQNIHIKYENQKIACSNGNIQIDNENMIYKSDSQLEISQKCIEKMNIIEEEKHMGVSNDEVPLKNKNDMTEYVIDNNIDDSQKYNSSKSEEEKLIAGFEEKKYNDQSHKKNDCQENIENGENNNLEDDLEQKKEKKSSEEKDVSNGQEVSNSLID